MNKVKTAILLLGPTGAGKTPLGNAMEQKGINGALCAHSDFGKYLRDITNENNFYGLSKHNVNFLKEILKKGALLENDTFYLAAEIIKKFLKQKAETANMVILNGLPRHEGQAMDIEPFFNIQTVIELKCKAETIFKRIMYNTGKDRDKRSDDHLDLVKKKLELYNTKTAPLLNYYKNKNVTIKTIKVDTADNGESLLFKYNKLYNGIMG
jgi:adenylate kinase family enzyme